MINDFCASGATPWLCGGLIIALACAAGIFLIAMLLLGCCLCKYGMHSEHNVEANAMTSDTHSTSCWWCCMKSNCMCCMRKEKVPPPLPNQTMINRAPCAPTANNTTRVPKKKETCCWCCMPMMGHHEMMEKQTSSCCMMCCMKNPKHGECAGNGQPNQCTQIGYAAQQPPYAIINGPQIERGWMWPMMDQGWTPSTSNGWMMMNSPNANPRPISTGNDNRMVLNNAPTASATQLTSCYQPGTGAQSNMPSYHSHGLCSSAPMVAPQASQFTLVGGVRR